MLIQKMNAAPVQRQLRPSFARLVGDPAHDIAWTPEVSPLIPFAPNGTHELAPGVTLKTAKLLAGDGLDGRQQKKIADISLSIATRTGALLKHQFPSAAGPVTGVEFFVATARAAQAWVDADADTVINPSLKTAQAVLSGLEVIKDQLPKVGNFSSHLKTIGLLVSVGDVVYQLYTIWQDDAPGATGGGGKT